MPDPIVALLLKQSVSRLNEMRTQAAGQISDLQQQVAWIDRAIIEKGAGSTSAISSAATPERVGRVVRRAGRRRSFKRDAILSVLSSHELDHVWTPNEVKDALHQLHGLDSTPEAVRVALRRMHEAGEVERGGPNNTGWKLPSNGDAPAERPADEPRSANGYAPEGALTLGSG